MILVVDASVAIKWILNIREGEDHCRQALEIIARIGDGRVIMVQPPHFLAEMGVVLAREKPADALSDLGDLMAVEFEPAAQPRDLRDRLRVGHSPGAASLRYSLSRRGAAHARRNPCDGRQALLPKGKRPWTHRPVG